MVKTFNLTGATPFYEPQIALYDLNTYFSGGDPIVTKDLNYVGSNDLFTGSPFYASGLPLNATLSYLSGFTGDITGALTGIKILTSGENYSSTSLPDIVISGNGENALATGLVSSEGALTGISVAVGGSGYSSSPTILIYSGVTSVDIVNAGQGYFSSPVIEFSGGREGGSAASGEVNVNENGTVSSISIINFGSRYTGIPTMNIVPGLSGINLTNSGSGYLSTPTVIIESGGGSGAVFNALTGHVTGTYSGFITGFNLISGGSGYTGAPDVTISGGSPSVTGSGEAILSSGFSGTVNMYSGASATAFVGDYTKEFTGVFNLLTGSGESYYNFREAGQITSDNLSYTGETIFFRENVDLNIGVESQINIKIDNYNYYDSLPLIAQLTISGSGSQISGVQVTGIK